MFYMYYSLLQLKIITGSLLYIDIIEGVGVLPQEKINSEFLNLSV